MSFTIARPEFTARALRSVAIAGCVLVALSCAGNLAAARASSSCPNEGFRTGPGANLPDCRAYEMVSPPDKNGGEVDGGPKAEGLGAPQQAALNGEAVTYASETTFPETGPLSSPLTSQYLSRRTAEGWSTQAIVPEQNFPDGIFDSTEGAMDFTLFQGFSENLEHGFLAANDPAPVAGAPAGYYNPYLRNDATGAYQLLSATTPPAEPSGPGNTNVGYRVEYAGMSADGTRVAFAANDALVPGAVEGRTNLYEWNDGKLELISVLPDKEATSGERSSSSVMFGLVEYEHAGLSGQSEGFNRVISSDGSRVIWTNSFSPHGEEPGPEEGVYVSELTGNGRVLHGPVKGFYQTASVDGSKVFIAHEDANVEGRRLSHLVLYEPATGRSEAITPPGSETIEVLGASEDGSYVYFDAYSVLAPGATGGDANIYLWHEGTISFIAGLAAIHNYGLPGPHEELEPDWAVREGAAHQYAGPMLHGNDLVFAGAMRVSPNGRYLAFEATGSLTGYENKPTEPGACFEVVPLGDVHVNTTGRCVEVYEYDATAGSLTCASCNPRGLPPSGNSTLPGNWHDILRPAGWQSTTVQQRYLLDDGRLFFQSTDSLLPQVTNGGQLNLFEYEPNTAGNCQLNGGCLSLISTGTSNEGSHFIDASANGNDVFFVTGQQLVAQDGDQAYDLYDARVGGGFFPATPPPCSGEACRPPVTPAPAIYQAPPSATFVGPGNPQAVSSPSTVAAKPKAKNGGKKRKHKANRRRRRGSAKRAARTSGASGITRGGRR